LTGKKSSRKNFVEEGLQRDVSDIAKQAGLIFPVFVTQAVWDRCICWERKDVSIGEIEKKRLWKVLNNLVYVLRVHRQSSKSNVIYFNVLIEKSNKRENIMLLSHVGPIDAYDRKPCITVMLSEEYSDESNPK